ncbi:MAG TPA: hypothetical protein DIU15_14610, partial [Deltaproteobacteria bacterium]|nr:hypothetical protein [Deltaproteobacteria bacterium]
GDTYYAWLELVVAARTDAVLRAKIHEVNTRFDQDAAGLYEELFPGVEQRPEGGSLSLSFAFATLGGLAVSAIHEDPERVRRIVDVLKRLSAMFDASNKTPGS